jgi:hypothetical protein
MRQAPVSIVACRYIYVYAYVYLYTCVDIFVCVFLCMCMHIYTYVLCIFGYCYNTYIKSERCFVFVFAMLTNDASSTTKY